MSNATCDLDPIPTDILKACIDEIIPSLTKIVNLSLTNSYVPTEFKKATVRPLIKKSTLDPESFKNYRPVSNLGFLSKLCEKIVSIRLQDHLDRNKLVSPCSLLTVDFIQQRQLYSKLIMTFSVI